MVTDDDGFVSRAAGKLAGALDSWPEIPVAGRVCLDAGASTGGFTQVLLRRGARHVYAVDVGHGQLSPAIASDGRVSAIEGLNVRELRSASLPEQALASAIDLVVGDLSFISLTLVIPVLARELGATDHVLLVKPQFEVGRQGLGKGGLVTRPADWRRAVEQVAECAESCGLTVRDARPSQVVGERGNKEFLLWLVRGGSRSRQEWERAIMRAIEASQPEERE